MRPAGRLAAALLVMGVWALAASGAQAQLRRGRAVKPDTKGCLDCHRKDADAYKALSSRHAPVAEGRCESCHLRHGVVGVLRLSAEDPQLCLTCHAMEGQPGTGQGPGEGKGPPAARAHLFSHPPSEALKCGTCHDPHGSDRPHLQRKEPRESCLECHSAEGFQGASAHTAATADCLACHDPHGSKLDGSLLRAPSELCSGCHKGTGAEERAAHGGNSPAAATCLSCHAPHASKSAGLMRALVHAPMTDGGGSCASCHVAEGEGATRFALQSDGATLCLTCHEDPTTAAPPPGAPTGAARAHAPVAEGDCTTCHDPHASDVAGLLSGPQSELCGACHTEAQAAREAASKHEPALGQCSACHLPHAGTGRLLRASEPGLCESCHAGVKEQVARSVPHAPAGAGDCTTCHAAHGSDHDGILKQAQGGLCASCHESIKQDMAARVSHAPARAGDCVSCHEPHGSSGAHLLAEDPTAACLSCHKLPESLFPENQRHAPFAAGDCLSCHRPHSSSREGLLTMEGGVLCRSCHGDLPGEQTANVKHLPVRRGQCLSCHGPHGGHTEALLLRADERTMCLSCHVEQGQQMSRQDLAVHPPFRNDSCLTCHTAHVSDHEGLLARQPASLCSTCHDTATAALRAPHKGLLTPTTDCTTCHESHAAEDKKLLLRDQHAPFGAGECAVCHQGAAVSPAGKAGAP